MRRVLSLFSGIGGIDLAAEAAGWEIVGQVEIDEFCRAVLEKHWPQVKRLEDIRDVKGTEFGLVDLIAGGIPCQPFSVAGKRRGQEDNRFLWPEMLRLIDALQPRWVLLENVAGFIPLALDEVSVDLEARGYETRAVVLPACAVGAPHIRERVFVVAHAHRDRQRNWTHQQEFGTKCKPASNTCIHGEQERLADPKSHAGQLEPRQRQELRNKPAINGKQGIIGVGQADASSEGLSLWERDTTPRAHTDAPRSDGWQTQPSLGRVLDGLPAGLDGRWPAGPSQEQEVWEPARTTQERITNRAARLKALGNAVCPQQIYPIFAAILAADSEGQP